MTPTDLPKLGLLALSCAMALAACGGDAATSAASGTAADAARLSATETPAAQATSAVAPPAGGDAQAAALPRAAGVLTGGDAPPAPQAASTAAADAAIAEKVFGSTACPAPSDGVAFDAATGFRWDAATQANALFALVNHLRCLGGVPAVARDARADTAALRHARYLVLNNLTGHYEDAARTGFSGVTPGERLRAAGYVPGAWGEVLSRSSALAVESWEGLVTAIYHRIGMLAPYVNAGVGIERAPDGRAVAVVDYASASALAPTGRLVTYPAVGQSDVPAAFDTNSESPDPSASLGIAGYPVSVQTDTGSTLAVDRLELVNPATGAAVASTLRANAGAAPGRQADTNLGRHAAFLLPNAPLAAGTTYEVRFAGAIDARAVQRTWRFTTRAAAPVAVPETTGVLVGQYAKVRLAGCSAQYSWSYSTNLRPSIWSSGWMQVQGVSAGTGTVRVTDGCGRSQSFTLAVR